jgi:hypothetical protein
MIRHSKHIDNKSEVDYILSLSSEDCARRSIILDLFADFGDGPKYNPYDTIDIPANVYGHTKKNKNKFKTTIGLYIFNKGCIEEFSDILGYINEPITAGKWEDINTTLSHALLEDKIELEAFKRLMMQSQIYMGCCTALASSHTDAIFDLNKEIAKKKKELIDKKYKDRLAKNDVEAAAELDAELIAYAKEYLKYDPSVDMYNSGARSSWSNNFKNMYLSKGAVKKTDGTFGIITKSYMEGIDKSDFALTNDSAVFGPYSRANKTSDGGYKEKLVTAATQHIKIAFGEDCGTTNTIKITLTKKNIDQWLYCFVKQGNKLVEITSDNKESFIGKTVDMRYSSLCQYTKDKTCICEKCIGTLYRRIGLKNIGLSASISMASIKLSSMKNFHNSTVSLYHVNAEDMF